jgi:hypothetical protein
MEGLSVEEFDGATNRRGAELIGTADKVKDAPNRL